MGFSFKKSFFQVFIKQFRSGRHFTSFVFLHKAVSDRTVEKMFIYSINSNLHLFIAIYFSYGTQHLKLPKHIYLFYFILYLRDM